MSRVWLTESEDETRSVGAEIARRLGGDARCLLFGPMGSGKTVLVQGMAAGLGIDPHEVQSPTFTLVREHAGPGGVLIHMDLYRLEPEDVAATGMEELLCRSGVKAVEWAERLEAAWRAGSVLLSLRRLAAGQHEIRELTPREAPAWSE